MSHSMTMSPTDTTTGSVATGVPRQKVIAAAGGSGVATAVAVLFLYLLQSAGVTLPSRVEDAVTAIIVAVLTFVAGYVCPPGASEGVTRDGGAIKSAIVKPV